MDPTRSIDEFRPLVRLEPALLAAKAAATPLWLGPFGTSRHRGRSPVDEARNPRTALLGLVDAKRPAVKLVAVEPLDGLVGGRFFGKLHETESSGTTGGAVRRKKYLDDIAHLRKKTFELALRCIVAQIADKDLGANDVPPLHSYVDCRDPLGLNSRAHRRSGRTTALSPSSPARTVRFRDGIDSSSVDLYSPHRAKVQRYSVQRKE